jgi:ribosomal protein S6--L-glutamate ligase
LTDSCCLQIGIVVERRYLTQAQPTGMINALQAQGHNVTVIDPQAVSLDIDEERWLRGFDIIVARGRSWPLLCLLAAAEAHEIPTINKRAAITTVFNKAQMAVALSAGNLKMPSTFLGSIRNLVNKVPAENYPLILKPLFGDNCQGLRVVNSPNRLKEIVWPEPVALAQHYILNDGCDLKLYGIGHEIWAVRKPSPLYMTKTVNLDRNSQHNSKEAKLLMVTPALQELGRRCGNLFNLELFGVDCIQTQDGLVVIDINDFPNYTCVPHAGMKLASYVTQRAKQRRKKL